MGSRARLGAAVLLAGCVGDKGGPGTGGTVDSGELACTEDDGRFLDLRLAETDVPTVATVRFETDGEGDGSVQWVDEEGGEHRSAGSAGATEHRFDLVGVRSSEQIEWRARLEQDGALYCSSPRSWQAGALSSRLPVLSLTGEPVERALALPLFTEQGSVLTVVDGHGRFVWAMDSVEQIWRAHFRPDGGGLYFNRQAAEPGVMGGLSKVDWDGTTTEIVSMEGMHADFVALPDGGFAALGFDVRQFVDDRGQTRTILGDTIIEVDANGEGGVIWSVFDAFTPDLDTDYPTLTDGVTEDWSHLNELSYDEENGHYLIPMGVIHGVLVVDRASATLEMSISGLADDVRTERVDTILNPHSVYRTEDDLYVIFNRRGFTDDCSEVIWLRVEGDQALTEATYTGTECRTVTYLGEARPIVDGGTLITWTTAGISERIDAAREPYWTLSASLGAAFGYSDSTETLGRPAE
jgi:hypothetical protein